MSPLRITPDETPAGPALHVVGELDYASSAALSLRAETLHLRPGQRLVINLAGVEFCDSTGITALLAARRHAQGAGAAMVLEAVPTHLLRIFTLAGLDQVFTIRLGDSA
ncbi:MULTISPECIES: STAS domain-containing protein [unclassified Streptomyces]|uniref:STAS domain-containing protein n=1 Tax=unclassified Streptomyces TaxID=2593676 RepID=UPI002E2B5C96|nr:STAS domain-containing protein [Streptomyces sp. NBC_01423]WSX95138.1 STAS domain-containing protein [Streptomyces sp. NBC_00891]WSY09618.1 STAS domain-containing protein [Streptomyces sp. NBC_00890]WSZ11238.1 STAS domain-containing protein [Streptomyces sp. NBC_00869]WSZ21257.1 STAS domain-containing protein [Streptomyces sp. NBC_00870]